MTIIKAKYPGRCAVCKLEHIRAGDRITRYGASWASVGCIGKERKATRNADRQKADDIDLHLFDYYNRPAGPHPFDPGGIEEFN